MRELTNNELKKYCLQILNKFHEICEKNGFRYSLAYGTLLGAVRHKGFIPWDDDIDVIMPREDYEKLLSLQYEDNSFAIKSYRYSNDYFYIFSKMISKETYLIEENRRDIMGAFIDIFPVDYDNYENVTENKMIKIIKNTKKYYVYGSKLDKKSAGKFATWIYRNIHYLFTKNNYRKHLYKLEKKCLYNHKEKECFINKVNCGYKTDFHDIKLWDSIVKIEFEGLYFNAFKDYDVYLKQIYGNYMKLPPEEKRITHHNFKVFKSE